MFLEEEGVGGTFREVLLLAGVLVHVEELFAVFALVVDNVFVAVGANHAAGDTGVIGSAGEPSFSDDVIPPFFRFLPEGKGTEGAAREVFWDRDSSEVEESGENVKPRRNEMFAIDDAGLRDAFLRDDEGNADGFIVENLFLVPVVRGDAFAVVAGKENEGVFFVPGVAECVENIEDQCVDLFDETIVAPEILPLLAVGPLRRWIVKIAIHFLYLPDDRRFVGGDVKVVGQGRAFFGRRSRRNRSVGQFLPAGKLADVVGVDEGGGEEKRLVPLHLEELGGLIRKVGILVSVYGGVTVDRRFFGAYADVPFPKVAAMVPGVGESPSEHGESSIDFHLVGDDTGFVGVAAGLDAGAARLAKGLVDVLLRRRRVHLFIQCSDDNT